MLGMVSFWADHFLRMVVDFNSGIGLQLPGSDYGGRDPKIAQR